MMLKKNFIKMFILLFICFLKLPKKMTSHALVSLCDPVHGAHGAKTQFY